MLWHVIIDTFVSMHRDEQKGAMKIIIVIKKTESMTMPFPAEKAREAREAVSCSP